MEFCPKCGTRLVSSADIKAKKPVFSLVCPKCGFKKQTGDIPSIVPKDIERSPLESIAIIGKEEQKLRTLPTVNDVEFCVNFVIESAWLFKNLIMN